MRNGKKPLNIMDYGPRAELVLDDLKIEAKKLISDHLSGSTKKNYLHDFARFRVWCIDHNLDFQPASTETVVLYLTSLSESHKYSSIARAATAIHRVYGLAGIESPVNFPAVKALLKGIRRKIGICTEGAKPITWKQLIQMVESEIPSFIGLRNKAILAIGWCGAMRRSEICSLNVEDIEKIENGIVLTIRRSKTDQESQGQKIFIQRAPEKSNFCPVKILEKLIGRLNRNSGPIFCRSSKRRDELFPFGDEKRMTPQVVTAIVKKMVRAIGLNPIHYSAHSLRRGFATECARLGIPERLIARQTRHRSMSALKRYIDDGDLTVDNPMLVIYGKADLSPPSKSPVQTAQDNSQIDDLSLDSVDSLDFAGFPSIVE